MKRIFLDTFDGFMIALAGTAAEIGVMVLSFIDIEIDKFWAQKQALLTGEEIGAAS